MDASIDFTSLSLEELKSSALGIDRRKFPGRAKEIDALISQKESEQGEALEAPVYTGNTAERIDRFLALCIDSLVLTIVMIVAVFFGPIELVFKDPSPIDVGIILSFCTVTYYTLNGYLLVQYSQTIGKRYRRIRVTTMDGQPANIVRIAFGRELPMALLRAIPFVGPLFSLIDGLLIFRADRRCLHDHIAQTKVCYVAEKDLHSPG